MPVIQASSKPPNLLMTSIPSLGLGLFIFKGIVGFITLVLLYFIMDIVDYIANTLDISPDNWGMKLAVFHTFFNLVGLIIFSFFIPRLVLFLKKQFVLALVEDEEDVAKIDAVYYLKE